MTWQMMVNEITGSREYIESGKLILGPTRMRLVLLPSRHAGRGGTRRQPLTVPADPLLPRSSAKRRPSSPSRDDPSDLSG